MTQSRTTGAVPSADHLMRHLLNTAGRLQQACRESTAAAARSATDRQHRLAETERSARQEANVKIASAPELANTRSLGSRLRGDLGKLVGVAVEHHDAGQAPRRSTTRSPSGCASPPR